MVRILIFLSLMLIPVLAFGQCKTFLHTFTDSATALRTVMLPRWAKFQLFTGLPARSKGASFTVVEGTQPCLNAVR